MKFSQVLSNIMLNKGISAYRMHKDTGIPEATIGRWRNGVSTPSQDNLRLIADYLNVSTDYLLGKEQKEKPDIPEDIKRDIEMAIEQMRKMPEEKRKEILSFIDYTIRKND